MFRAAYAKRRCLVPVDSYFEWAKSEAQGRKARRVHRPPSSGSRRLHRLEDRGIVIGHAVHAADPLRQSSVALRLRGKPSVDRHRCGT